MCVCVESLFDGSLCTDSGAKHEACPKEQDAKSTRKSTEVLLEWLVARFTLGKASPVVQESSKLQNLRTSCPGPRLVRCHVEPKLYLSLSLSLCRKHLPGSPTSGKNNNDTIPAKRKPSGQGFFPWRRNEVMQGMASSPLVGLCPVRENIFEQGKEHEKKCHGESKSAHKNLK